MQGLVNRSWRFDWGASLCKGVTRQISRMNDTRKFEIEVNSCSGPFEVRCSHCPETASSRETPHNPVEAAAHSDNSVAPERDINCTNYQACLNLAAALNWDAFTCQGCNRTVNESLRWRACHTTKHDAVAKALCGVATLTDLRTSTLGAVAKK